MKPLSTFSPISLNYIAALRGHKPKKTGTDFAYADAVCREPEQLICLAASNPDGRFYGFVADEAARRTGEEKAAQRGIFNAIFLVGSPSQILSRLDNGSTLPPMLDYLCCDQNSANLAANERTALLDLAHKRLNPGGLLATTYRAYDNEDGALRFLVRELAPEMNEDQKQEFLIELKNLAATYLSRHPETALKLNDAIVKGKPGDFLSLYAASPAASGTFDMIVAMGSRNMAYAGDTSLTSNYVELAVPAEAQDIVVKCRNHFLYEPIKDLVLDRTVRSDIWIKAPFSLSSNPAELFGGFAYGVTLSSNEVPSSFTAQGKKIDLGLPIYAKLIQLMSTLPMGIGDFLSHPSSKGEKPEKIIEAIQILVACGIAKPMRGVQTRTSTASVARPRFVGSFNRYLDRASLTDASVVRLASPVLGCGIEISVRDALVMQALNRAGLANCVTALMPELRRLAEGPVQKAHFVDALTPESARKMIQDVVEESLPQWYAYGLLEAA